MAIRDLVRPALTSPARAPRLSPTKPARKPFLTLVPSLELEARVHNTRFFISAIGAIAVLTFAGLLTINTLLTQDAITIQKLKLEALTLNEHREATIKELESISNPSSLASAAEALGMRPSENPQFLDLSASAVKP